MIKHNIITVEYRPKAKHRFRFRYNVWRNGKIVKSRCSPHLSCHFDICHSLDIQDEKYPLHVPLSVAVAEIIQKKDHYRNWIKLRANKKENEFDIYSYIMWDETLRYLIDSFERRKKLYKTTDKQIEEGSKKDPNDDIDYPLSSSMMEVFDFYAYFKKGQTDLYPEKYADLTDKLRFMISDLWNVLRLFMMVKEYDPYKCMTLFPTLKELDAESDNLSVLRSEK